MNWKKNHGGYIPGPLVILGPMVSAVFNILSELFDCRALQVKWALVRELPTIQ